MLNLFKNRGKHTAEPERKYGLYARSYYIVGLAAAGLWVWLVSAEPLKHSVLQVLDMPNATYAAGSVPLFAFLPEGAEASEQPKVWWRERNSVVARDDRTAARIVLLSLGSGFFFLWIMACPYWAILRKPDWLPYRIHIGGFVCVGLWLLSFVNQTGEYMTASLWQVTWLVLTPMAFLCAPTYAMLLKECAKETNFYQETFIEGSGRESGRWAGLLTYLRLDISAWYEASKHRIHRTKESPLPLGRTMWPYDYKLGGRHIGLISEQHHILVGGTGAGKSVTALNGILLSWNGGCIAFTTKREHVELAYERRAGSAPANVIEPFAKDGKTAIWNPVHEIDKDSPSARGDLTRIAAALIPQEKGERAVDIHFREIPQKIVRGYL